MGFTDVLGAIASPVAAVGSVATSLINRHSQKETNKRNQEENELNRQFNAGQSELERQFNSAEAEKSRFFNASEAQKSRLFNAEQAAKQMEFEREMWDAENAYNEPSAQIARLKSAGLNPNLFGGDNTAGSAGSGVAASSSPATSSPASSKALGASGSIPMQAPQLGNVALQAAQIKLAQAQAKQATSQAEKNQTESDRIKALLAGELEIQNSTYRVQLSESMRNEANAKESLANIDKINADKDKVFAQIDEIRQNISNMEKSGKLTQKELDSYETRLASQLQEALSRTKMNGAALISYLASADASSTQARLNEEQQRKVCQDIIHQGIQNDILRIDYRIKDKTELSTIQLVNSTNTLKSNDIAVQDESDWRFARLFLGTLGQVFNSNLSIKP